MSELITGNLMAINAGVEFDYLDNLLISLKD